jgi:hypothetical protein
MKSESSTAQINCTVDSSMHFSQSQSIHITNLEFIGCGGNQVIQVKEFLITDTTFEGRENSGTALELIGTTAQIVNSTFVSNRKGSNMEFFLFGGDNLIIEFVGGAIIGTNNTTVTISQSKFEDNKADYGGAIFADNYSIINLTDNVSFVNNLAGDGGVLYSGRGVIATINASTFYNNTGLNVLSSSFSTLIMEASEFHDNFVSEAGILILFQSSITIEASKFHGNVVNDAVVLSSINSNLTIEGSVFNANNGGVLLSKNSTIMVGDCNFTNSTSLLGIVIFALDGSKIQYHNHLLIDKNSAVNAIVLYDSEFIGYHSGNFTFSNTFGSLLAVNSNITFSGNTKFVNNQPPTSAITLFQSNVFIDGECNLKHNHAENG